MSQQSEPRTPQTPRPRAKAKKSKKGRKVVAVSLAVLIAAGCGGGGFYYYQSNHQSSVNVYAMSNLAMTDYWGDQSESDGAISTEDLQTVYLSTTQQLSEILVTEGQTVQKGDPLFTYDSTLTQLDLDRADLAIQQQELDLEAAQKELTTIKTYRAGVPIPGSSHFYPYEDTDTGETDEPELLEEFVLTPTAGDGSAENPFLYAWSTVMEYNGGSFDSDTFRELAQGLDEAYVMLQMPSDVTPDPDLPVASETVEDPSDWAISGDYEEPTVTEDISGDDYEDTAPIPEEPISVEEPAADAYAGEELVPEESASVWEDQPVTPSTSGGLSYSSLSLQIQCVDETYSYAVLSMSVNGISVTLSDPLPALEQVEEEPGEELPEESESSELNGYYDPGITYTAAEIAQMISEKEQEIRGLELDIRQSKLDYEKLAQEAENTTVYSELDGTVVLLADPDSVSDADPLIKVSAEGSYTITAVLGEFDLDGVYVGQVVDVNVYGSSYTSCQGVITWISEYPSTSDSYYYYYSGGNSNISKYPFTVEVDGSENLSAGDYAEIYYTPEGQEKSGLYLQNEFIRSENGKSYVYVEVDGQLEKRYVTTGMSVWGSYTEIRSGLTIDDYLAFPYGTNVKEGAQTTEADISDLYSSAYY